VNQLVLVEESPSDGTRHPVIAGMTIGREGTEIVLADPEVSRRHAKVRALDDALAIEDLGSTNGTYVNGQRVTGVAELKDGDAIKMGNSALRVEALVEDGATRLTPIQADPAPPEPAAAAPPAVEATEAMPAPAAEAEPPPPVAAAPPAPSPPSPPPAAVAPPPPPPPAPTQVEPAPSPPAPAAAPAPAPPQPPATSPAPAAPDPADQATQFGQVRGDVPAPPPASASRVHQAINLTSAPPQHEFDAGGTGGTRRGSAATRLEATVIAYAIVIATAAAVIFYLLTEKF